MKRWIIVLGLAMAQWLVIAVATSQAGTMRHHRALETNAAATRPVSSIFEDQDRFSRFEPLTRRERRRQESGSRSGSHLGSDCDGGRRIISAYYWEGTRTASGQRFDPHGLTAAHRTLPFGTALTVSNPRTGKSVTVVVNDRGPFVSGIGLDLSLGAAQAIGMRGTGAVCIL